VRTLNEVVSKSQNIKQAQDQIQAIQASSDPNSICQQKNDEIQDANNKTSLLLEDVVESTFEEFILAAVSVAAATASVVNTKASSNKKSVGRCSGSQSIQFSHKHFLNLNSSNENSNDNSESSSLLDLKKRLYDISKLSKELQSYNDDSEVDDEEDDDDDDDDDDDEGKYSLGFFSRISRVLAYVVFQSIWSYSANFSKVF